MARVPLSTANAGPSAGRLVKPGSSDRRSLRILLDIVDLEPEPGAFRRCGGMFGAEK